MNIKITNKAIRYNYPVILHAGYCEWDNIIRICGWQRVGYAAGTYGWNYNAYEITPYMCVVTGYRGFPKATHETDYKIMRKFNCDAGSNEMTNVKKRNKLVCKIMDYISSVVNGDKTV